MADILGQVQESLFAAVKPLSVAQLSDADPKGEEGLDHWNADVALFPLLADAAEDDGVFGWAVEEVPV